MSLALGNTTWDLFSQKGHHHRAGVKSHGMLFFEMAKWQKCRHGNSDPDVNEMCIIPWGVLIHFFLRAVLLRLSVDQGRRCWGAGRVRTEGVLAEPGCPRSHPSFKWTSEVGINFVLPLLLLSYTLRLSIWLLPAHLWLSRSPSDYSTFLPFLTPNQAPWVTLMAGLSSSSLILVSHCFHTLSVFTSE